MVGAGAARTIRAALLLDLAPCKLGSFEDWLLALAEGMKERGHRLDIYGHEPIHPQLKADLTSLGVSWFSCEIVRQSPLRASRFLAANYDVVQLHFWPPRSRVALAAYAAWPAKVLYIDHNSGPQGTRPGSMIQRVADHCTALRLAGVAGVSDYVRSRAFNRFGLAPDRVRTIYNGIDVRRYSPSDAVRTNGEFRVLCVSQLIPEKGIDLVLQAFADAGVPFASLTVVGAGPEADRLKHLACTLGIADAVRFIGMSDDVPAYLAACDVFVHAARWQEAFGLGVAEAMAAGRAVIATRVGAMSELIVDDESGVLVPPENVSALSRAISSLAADPVRRFRLGTTARRRIESDFSMARCVAAHLNWMRDVANPVR